MREDSHRFTPYVIIRNNIVIGTAGTTAGSLGIIIMLLTGTWIMLVALLFSLGVNIPMLFEGLHDLREILEPAEEAE